MKYCISLLLSIVLMITSVLSHADDIPSSPRARKAIARVKPALQKALSGKNLKWGSPVFMRVFKKSKELEVWVQDEADCFKLFKTYEICTYGWMGELGPKAKQGDGQAPEGFYFVTPRRLNPVSAYHLSFDLGYPNTYDAVHGRTGSALMVHGSCVSIGCYAMTDKQMEEIYALADAALRNGQPFFRVHIFPFRMTDANMKKYEKSNWMSFWQNLKEGHDFFEDNKCAPPNVEVMNRRYVFASSRLSFY